MTLLKKHAILVGSMHWTEYFITFGLLFAGYGLIRWSFVYQWRALPPLPRDAPAMTGKGLDAQDLNDQVKNLRTEMNHGRVPIAHHPDVTQALRVEEKREELAKLSFFQPKPPAPESNSQEHTLGVLVA